MRNLFTLILPGVLVCAVVSHPADVTFAAPKDFATPPDDALGFPSRDPNLDALPGFQNPPPGYAEVPFWWWTGDPLQKERLLWQIDQLHEKGISGMQVNYAHEDSPGWPTYAAEPEIFSETWWDVWKYVAGECGRRGMGIGLSGYTLDWPGGRSLISRTIYGDPEIQGREIAVARKQRVAAGQALACHLPDDTVAVRAYPCGEPEIGPGSVDLLDSTRRQRLEWTPPEGDWEVWVFTAARKPGTLNPIHPLAGRRVVEQFFQAFQDHAPGRAAAGLNYFFHDELHFGVGDRLWTDDLPEQFQRCKGYDLFEALPAIFQDVGPMTVKYRLDFMNVKMQLAQKRYFIPIFQWHWSRGKIYGCDQGSRGRNPLEFGDYFSAVRWYTAPGHDTPGGRADLIKGKVSSSIAHLYRRPRVWLEGYHSLGWGATPENLMFATRENYLYGCNLLSLHGLYYTTHGSFWEWAPPCYHFRMPYWEHMGAFLKYFERLSYLMSQGVHRCDVAVMYPVAPGQAGLGGREATDAAFAAGTTLMNHGYDFIFIDFESLSRAEIRDRRLHVADASYRVLVLPAMRAVRWSTLQKARQFFRSGGIVIAGGALPEASDHKGCDDPELDAVVRELFGATAAQTKAGARPPNQHNDAGGIGIAILPDHQVPVRRYDGGFVGRWAWAREPAERVYFRGVWRAPAGANSVCHARFFCDNEGALYVNGSRICSGVDYSTGWTGKIALKDGDVITIDARDHDPPGKRGTAGMFLAIVQDGKTRFSTEDLRYALAPPSDDAWRTSPDTTGLSVPDPANVHELHRGGATGDLWSTAIRRLENLVPRDVQGDIPIKATHRKVGPRDVYMVMGAPKNSTVEFRAKGRAEWWDPWTGAVRPLRVLGETTTGTKVQLPLEDYEAQIVVFTPDRRHVNPPQSSKHSVQEIVLDGDWEFELKPTMDNRYGDFRLPVTGDLIGAEARIFRHAVETGNAAAWQEPDFDDHLWERVTCDFGPQFWLLGPIPADGPAEAIDARLANLTRVNPAEAIDVAGQPYRWRPYGFSWRQGREGDPGHQGYHGLKKNVTDHFLCLGKRENALNEFKYVPEAAGSRYYLWTSATVDRRTTARIVASTRREGETPHASEVLTPAAVFLKGQRVDDLQQAVSLQTGANSILVRYDRAGRGYLVLKRDEPPSTRQGRTPLSMTWFDDPSVIRFDVHAGRRPAEWFRFTAPPGLRAMTVTARGSVEAWADGRPMRDAGQGRFEAATPLPRAARVALRVKPETGFCGAAVFPDPVRLECGPGVTALGDWSKMGALECYSGGAWYRKTVVLTPRQAGGRTTLDLGRVVATAEVRVNGQLAGVRVAPPWKLDVTGRVKPGENRIEILVYNTLANHYVTIPTRYRGDLTSGLLGPVALEVATATAAARAAPLAGHAAEDHARLPPAVMPRVEDYTHVAWADGFPAHVPGAPWRRVIQTGYYAIVLDTETLRISHLGPLPGGVSYAAAARADNRAWQRLPPAQLALSITARGKTYRCTAGGPWSQFKGPRLVESGRFLQRADVTDLVFTAEDGATLNVEARFETVAWPDRLALILAARPGLLPFPAGESCFGRVGGGFGLDGTNHLEIAHGPELDPERFTLELWAFVPTDYQASPRTFPWLVCKNHHEEAEGNYGIILLNGRPQARLNIGGGRDNMFLVEARSPLKINAWNHLAISYDGRGLRLYVNGELSGEQRIGRKRVPGREGLAFGRRQDNWGDGYHFRGAVDEIRLYDRALTPAEIRERFRKPEAMDPDLNPVRRWTFQIDGTASLARPAEQWTGAAMEISLTTPHGTLRRQWELPPGQTWSSPDWHEVSLAFHPLAFEREEPTSAVSVQAGELPNGAARPVDYDAVRGWHRVNLDGIEAVVPPGGHEKHNDAIERVRLVLSNPADREQTARLLFEKNARGFRQRIGVAVTGMSAVLRDADGHPLGIPVQLSKNWHGRPEGGVYAGLWFHGFTQVRLPPRAEVELELALVYGHWGGVAAASHAQLCLIGWGSNQLWNQSALGSWGESICYEPDQVQGQCTVLDVRPLMVRSMSADQPWHWTHNVGGGDFFRLFDAAGRRVPHARIRTAYERYGPCLTEVTYAGRIGEGIEHSVTVSLARTDDVVRGTYRLRLDVDKPVDFSRFVIFQIGADTYSYTGERKMAVGNETGLIREWPTQWGGATYRTDPLECTGRVPWISLHEAVSRAGEEAAASGRQGAPGAWANRGIVIRSWKAQLGGKPAAPWVAEHGVKARGEDTSTADVLPPPGVTRLEPGDFVQATLEHVIVPQFAADYYGPNEALRAALGRWENTWRMIHREAVGNDRRVEIKTGTLESLYPAACIRTANDVAEFTMTGGLGYVPVTFTGLTSPRGHLLVLDNQTVNQAVHGSDFWQTDYDPAAKRWSRTYNIPVSDDTPHTIRLQRNP